MSTCVNCELEFEQGRIGEKSLCKPCKDAKTGTPAIQLTPLTHSDLELVMAWRSNPKIYRYFREQNKPLRWEDHVDWFRSRSERRYDFIIHYDERRVGVVNIDMRDNVGVYVGDFEARGMGVATKSIDWLCSRFENREPLTAEICEENNASKRLFQRCGFQQVDKDGDWLIYSYES